MYVAFHVVSLIRSIQGKETNVLAVSDISISDTRFVLRKPVGGFWKVS
jgi:hypothetical protein